MNTQIEPVELSTLTKVREITNSLRTPRVIEFGPDLQRPKFKSALSSAGLLDVIEMAVATFSSDVSDNASIEHLVSALRSAEELLALSTSHPRALLLDLKRIRELAAERVQEIRRDLDWRNRGEDQWQVSLAPLCDLESSGDCLMTPGAPRDQQIRIVITPCQGWISRLGSFEFSLKQEGESAALRFNRGGPTSLQDARCIRLNGDVRSLTWNNEMESWHLDFGVNAFPGEIIYFEFPASTADYLGGASLTIRYHSDGSADYERTVAVMRDLRAAPAQEIVQRRNPYISGRALAKYEGAAFPKEVEPPKSDSCLIPTKSMESVVAGLLSLYENEGQIIRVLGLRGVGKTTLARFLYRRLAWESERFAPVYVDMKSWSDLRQSKRLSITDEDLAYEWAVECVKATTDYLHQSDPTQWKNVEDLFAQYLKREKQTLSQAELAVFISRLLIAIGRSAYVFLLDGTEDWRRASDRNWTRVEGMLQDLLKRKSVHAIVLFDRPNDYKVLPEKNAPNDLYLAFLDEAELAKLLAIAASFANRLTPIAEALIWKLTGGWPELTQAFLRELFVTQSDGEVSEADKAIDTIAVRRAFQRLLGTEEFLELLPHWLAGLERNELHLLDELRRTADIDMATGCIKGVLWNEVTQQVSGNCVEPMNKMAFVGLIRKQILDAVLKTDKPLDCEVPVRLRVGLLALRNFDTTFVELAELRLIPQTPRSDL